MYRVQDLPASLQIELMRHRYSDLLARVPFFANLSMTALDELCQNMQSVSLTPGDPIVVKGENANELLILSQGIARSSTKGDDSAYQTYTVGCFWVRTKNISWLRTMSRVRQSLSKLIADACATNSRMSMVLVCCAGRDGIFGDTGKAFADGASKHILRNSQPQPTEDRSSFFYPCATLCRK